MSLRKVVAKQLLGMLLMNIFVIFQSACFHLNWTADLLCLWLILSKRLSYCWKSFKSPLKYKVVYSLFFSKWQYIKRPKLVRNWSCWKVNHALMFHFNKHLCILSQSYTILVLYPLVHCMSIDLLLNSFQECTIYSLNSNIC